MRIDFARAWARMCFFVAVVLVAAALTFFGVRAYVAARWQASSNPELWAKAVRLEPGNAEYWGRVGRSRQWDLSPDGANDALGYLQKAVEVNPRSSELWLELADSYQAVGDSTRAQGAFQWAQSDYPISSEIAWRYGSFLLYQGKFLAGYAEIQRAISVDPSLTQSAVAECWLANPNIAPIVDNVLPLKSEYYAAAIDYFVSQSLPTPALEIWSRQVELGPPSKLRDVIPLVDILIDQNRMSEAHQTWRQALERAKWPGNPNDAASLVFNGGFEEDFSGGGFDWRETAATGSRFEFDSRTAHDGSRSLRVEFDGSENLDFQNLSQYVAVRPKSRYHFSGYLRTEGISTDSGIRFEILDPAHPAQVRILTQSFAGTNPWTQVHADFVTGADTQLLKIALRRIPSWKFDNKLSGRVWVDDVTLTPGAESLSGLSK